MINIKKKASGSSEYRRSDFDTAALIGLDLGTTGLKAAGILGGEVFAHAHERMDYITCGARLEFEPERFYRKVLSTIANVARELPRGATVKGISVSSAGGNTLLLRQDGAPLMNFISWRDGRQTGEAREVLGPFDPDALYRVTGWPFSGMFPLAHLCWLRVHESGLLQTAAKVCMSADYVIWRLTGRWGMDRSTATTSYLQDQVKGRWHAPLLEKLGLDDNKLPQLMDTGARVGGLSREAARDTGLSEGTGVYVGSFDHPSAARGAGALCEGDMLLSCGTSWVCFVPTEGRERPISLNMLCDPFLREENLWAGMHSLPNVSAKIEAALSNILPDAASDYARFDALALASEPGAGGLTLSPDDDFCMPPGEHPARHVARALMEGTAYALRERIEALEADGMAIRRVFMVGGPSLTMPWPQILCDILGRPMKIVNGAYAGAIGAAAVAGVSAGVYRDIHQASADVARGGKALVPTPGFRDAYEAGFKRYKQI